jgi:hypothetical protein
MLILHWWEKVQHYLSIIAIEYLISHSYAKSFWFVKGKVELGAESKYELLKGLSYSADTHFLNMVPGLYLWWNICVSSIFSWYTINVMNGLGWQHLLTFLTKTASHIPEYGSWFFFFFFLLKIHVFSFFEISFLVDGLSCTLRLSPTTVMWFDMRFGEVCNEHQAMNCDYERLLSLS